MKKILIYLLVISTIVINALLLPNGVTMPLYYIVWVLGVGWYLYKNYARVEALLRRLPINGFFRFLILGLTMVLFEEMIAGIVMKLPTATSVADIILSMQRYITMNFLILPGLVIGWYILLRLYQYSRVEVLVLSGLFGLFAEKVYSFGNPLLIGLLILPTMATYAVIMTPALISYNGKEGAPKNRVFRYVLGFVVPFIVTMPFIGILTYLMTTYPMFFPPEHLPK